MANSGYFDALPAGYSLFEYRIDSVLGQGGFGITYKAHDANLNKWVALKEYLPEGFARREGQDLIRPKPGSEEDFKWGLERFEREAQTLAQFEHPNIVPVIRRFAANGTIYMVMGYQEGESLDRILDHTTRLEESELEEILYPLLDGLGEVHSAGILHRDIKPENIYIRLADGSPVLLDFGAARAAMGSRGRSVTRIVTPNYAPYEQYYSEGHLGPWTDIYALAAVLYEGITGEPPPEAPARVATDKLKRATDVGAGQYREEFLAAIDWALAVAPEDRPQTVAEWRKALPQPMDPALASATDAAVRSAAPRAATTRLAQAAASASHQHAAYQQKRGKRAAGSAAAPTHRGGPGAAAARPLTLQQKVGGARGRWVAAAAIVLVLGGLGTVSAFLAAGPESPVPDSTASLGISLPQPSPGDGDAKDEESDEEKKRKAAEARRRWLALVKARERARRQRMVRMFSNRRLTTRLPGREGLTLIKFYGGGKSGGVLHAVTSPIDDSAMEINERGTWVTDGKQLCIRLSQWNRGRRACFQVSAVTRNPSKVPFQASGTAGTFKGTLVKQ